MSPSYFWIRDRYPALHRTPHKRRLHHLDGNYRNGHKDDDHADQLNVQWEPKYFLSAKFVNHTNPRIGLGELDETDASGMGDNPFQDFFGRGHLGRRPHASGEDLT